MISKGIAKSTMVALWASLHVITSQAGCHTYGEFDGPKMGPRAEICNLLTGSCETTRLFRNCQWMHFNLSIYENGLTVFGGDQSCSDYMEGIFRREREFWPHLRLFLPATTEEMEFECTELDEGACALFDGFRYEDLTGAEHESVHLATQCLAYP